MTPPLDSDPCVADRSLIAVWNQVVARDPAALAVIEADGPQLSYGELDAASTHLARRILESLGPENVPVLLLTEPSCLQVAGILGVIKAHKAFVLLDPRQPAGFLRPIAAASGARLLLAAEPLEALARAIGPPGARVETLGPLDTTPAPTLANHTTADSIAALIFTSGSTGLSKGVIYPHRMLAHRAWCEHRLGLIGPGHRLAGLRHCGFSAGAADLFKSLLTGAAYCPFTVQSRGLQALSRWLTAQPITYLPCSVELLRQWLDSLGPHERFPHLCRLYPSGRKLRTDFERIWPLVAPECLLISSYGSTEASLMSLALLTLDSTPGAEVLDVGHAVPGKRILICDEAGAEVAPGETGEIEILSRFIAPGYWGEPALTGAAFRQADDGNGDWIYRTGDLGRLRPDGALELQGRRDAQVKVRGYRVVLGQVEIAVQALPGVRQAVVVLDQAHDCLLGYVRLAPGSGVTGARLTAQLAESLPDYAVPARWIVLPEFPLLPSGKVNVWALPPPGRERPALKAPFVAPRTETEARLAALWSRLLAIDGIGIDDPFVELGGHSLLSVRLLIEIEQHLGGVIPTREFFANPTVRQLAHLLDRPAPAPVTAPPETQTAPTAAPESAGPRLERSDEIFDRAEGFIRASKPQRLAQNWNLPTQLVDRVLGAAGPSRAAALLAALTRRPVGRRLFGQMVPRLTQFHAEVRSSLALETFLAQSLYCYLIDRYGIGVPGDLRGGSDRAGARAARVIGWEALEDATRAGRGVLLVRSHDHARRWFRPLGLSDFRVTDARHVIQQIDRPTALDATAIYVHQLDLARKHLAEGRVVEIHGDGVQGTSQAVQFPFHGRRRGFLTGFAELALWTRATVFVVESIFHEPLDVSVHLVGPLDRGLDDWPHDQRVQHLLTQYVGWLSSYYARQAWMVPFFEVEQHLDLPAWAPAHEHRGAKPSSTASN